MGSFSFCDALTSGESCPKYQALCEFLERAALADEFTDCVFDFLQLIDLNYAHFFKCTCLPDSSRNSNVIAAIYDNGCNVMHTLLRRLPVLARQIMIIIDTMHYNSHSRCSPFFNKKAIKALVAVNSALNEQKNVKINYLRTTLSHMGQVRAMHLLRCACSRMLSSIHCNQETVVNCV